MQVGSKREVKKPMRVNKLPMLLVAVAAILLVTGVSSAAGAAGSKKGASTSVVRISSRSVPQLGRILVNSQGRTLYMFVPDKRKRVTCVKNCATIWPPVKVASGARIVGSGGVKASLLKSDSDPAGGRVVTYNGWPLYTYLGDRKAGVAFGQALNLNGGLWYVLSTSGAVIKTKPHSGTSGGGGSGGGPSTTTSGGGKSQCTDADGDGDEDAGGPDDGDGCL